MPSPSCAQWLFQNYHKWATQLYRKGFFLFLGWDSKDFNHKRRDSKPPKLNTGGYYMLHIKTHKLKIFKSSLVFRFLRFAARARGEYIISWIPFQRVERHFSRMCNFSQVREVEWFASWLRTNAANSLSRD